ncbi:glycine cleavage system protein GcvH [Streptomyces sp. NPDC002265]|uniref:glycine cleavage system protein GcvH n=1 Tax=Streptomyces sp. NPDC002265 TaxID=3154415 RepID=UPI00332DC6AC
MTVPADLKYSKDHEWVSVVSPKEVRIGITDYAQRQLGDVVFVEQPKKGDRFESSHPFSTVESVKAVSEIYMPVDGTVVAVNEMLVDEPELINTDPYGDGWIVQVAPSRVKDLDQLLSAAQYEKYVASEED